MSKFSWRTLRILLISSAALLPAGSAAAPAHALSAYVQVNEHETVLYVEAGMGETNDLWVQKYSDESVATIQEYRGHAIAAGAGCRSSTQSPTYATCDVNDVDRIEVLLWDGDDALQGGSGIPMIANGMDGNDHLDVSAVDVRLNGDAGDDRLRIAGRSGGIADGGEGHDQLSGRVANSLGGVDPNGSHELIGGNGNDLLQAELGSHTLRGGAGDDRLVGGEQPDLLDPGTGRDTQVDGGGGADTVSYASRTTGVTVSIDGASNDGNGDDGVVGARDNVTNVETVLGGAGDDHLTAGAVNTTLRGNNGNDQLQGLSGDDVLDGGEGSDRMQGGAGSDTADYSSRVTTYSGPPWHFEFPPAPVTVVMDNSANDGSTLDGSGDDVRSDVEVVLGTSANDTLTGTFGTQRLDGRDGNDTINGAGGEDVLVGGNGDDTLQATDGDTFDLVLCGAGADTATGDVIDTFEDCEAVDAPVPAEPTNVTPPQLTVTRTNSGYLIECSPGTWASRPASYTYELMVDEGATNSWWGGAVTSDPRTMTDRAEGESTGAYLNYQLPYASEIYCRVSVVNRGGSASALSPTRERYGRADLPAPVAISDGPTISGGSSAGEVVSCDPGPWRTGIANYVARLETRWVSNGVQVATGATYELAQADVGKVVSCQVAEVNSPYPLHPVTHARNPITVDGLPWSSSATTVSGSSAIGSALSCNPGTWTRAASFSYAWHRSARADGAESTQIGVGASYTTLAADAGAYVWCVAVAQNAVGTRNGAPATPIRIDALPPTQNGGGTTPPPADTTDDPPTPPPAQPTGDRIAPAVKLALARVVRLNARRPVLLLRFTCPRTEVRCRYASTLRYRAGRRNVVIGRATALVNRRQTRLSSVPLNVQGKRQLRRLKGRAAIRATLTVVVTDKAGNKRTLRRTVLLRRR